MPWAFFHSPYLRRCAIWRPTWDDQEVVFLRIHVVDDLLDLDSVAMFAFQVPFFRRHDFDVESLLEESKVGEEQLEVFELVRRQNQGPGSGCQERAGRL